MVIKYVIVYEIQPLVDSKDLYNVSTISTDAFDKKAFRVNNSIFLPHTTPKFGDMFEIKDTELEKVTGGMKVDIEEKEELSWWETLMNFFFNVKS